MAIPLVSKYYIIKMDKKHWRRANAFLMERGQAMKDILLLIFGYFIRFFYDKLSEKYPKVVYNLEEVRGFTMPATATAPVVNLWQHSIHFANFGKSTATNIKISHNYLPPFRNVSSHAVQKTHDDVPNKIITVDSIAPKEVITLTYLDMNPYQPKTMYNKITYDQGIAKEIPILIVNRPKKWVIVVWYSLAVIGLCYIIYFLFFQLPSLMQTAQALIIKLKAIKP